MWPRTCVLPSRQHRTTLLPSCHAGASFPMSPSAPHSDRKAPPCAEGRIRPQTRVTLLNRAPALPPRASRGRDTDSFPPSHRRIRWCRSRIDKYSVAGDGSVALLLGAAPVDFRASGRRARSRRPKTAGERCGGTRPALMIIRRIAAAAIDPWGTSSCPLVHEASPSPGRQPACIVRCRRPGAHLNEPRCRRAGVRQERHRRCAPERCRGMAWPGSARCLFV